MEQSPDRVERQIEGEIQDLLTSVPDQQRLLIRHHEEVINDPERHVDEKVKAFRVLLGAGLDIGVL